MSPVALHAWPAPGLLLVLNGCSSAGKTSLASALQRQANDLQLLHVQLDAFRQMEPDGYFGPARRDDVTLRTAALCRSLQAAALQFVRHGQNTILDHVLSPEAWSYLLEDPMLAPAFVIRVECALAEAERRETLRNDRPPGLARTQHHTIHAGRVYDFAVDTSERSPEACASALAAWLRTGPQPNAIAAMREARNVA